MPPAVRRRSSLLPWALPLLSGAASACGPNLLPGSDFETGMGGWGSTLLHGFTSPLGEWKSAHAPVGESDPRLKRGALCTTVRGGQTVQLGWRGHPDATLVSLEPEKRYRLGFRMSSAGALSVHVVVEVGCRQPPWTPVVQAPIPVGESDATYVVDFRPGYSEARGGVAFVPSAPRGEAEAEVCVDDVSLVGG